MVVSRAKTPTRVASPHTVPRTLNNRSSKQQQQQQHQPHHAYQHHSSNNAQVNLLVELIEHQQFEEAINRVRKFPEEATYFSSVSADHNAHNSIMNQGNLALHEACKSQPPIELIDALLAANEEAVRTKGQWGYLPLHFACCSRASPQVVARLIVTYPSATRTKDDHEGRVPLHLAAKWGADDEVIMALLTVHPKASSARDSLGKTPLEHANGLSSSHVREGVVKALRRAPILCAVSKAAMNKLAYESDAKLREVVEVYQERMTQIKDKYEEDKTHAVALEVQLRKELWEEKERASNLSEKVILLTQQLQEQQNTANESNDTLQQIQGLISGKLRRQPQPAIQQQQPQQPLQLQQPQELTILVDEQQESEHREAREDARAKRKEQRRLAKNAVRDWVAAGTTTDPHHQQVRDDIEERREQPPALSTKSSHPSPSPRSAAVANVKEWFSSEANELQQQDDDHHHQNRKEISYRHQKQQQQQQQEQVSAQSLLNRSKSAPRTSAVLARSAQDQSRSRSNSIRPKSPGPEPRLRSSRGEPSCSTSSRITQGHGNVRPSQSHSSSTRRQYAPKSPGRPRESYSVTKPHTSSTYAQRIMDDDVEEDPTINSRAEWE
jgi:hypothetical protein